MSWDEFLHWARRMSDEVDTDTEEYNYKRDLAQRLATVREQLLGGDPGWSTALLAELNPSKQNLLHWRFVQNNVRPAIQDHEDVIREAILLLWGGGAPAVESLDDFTAKYRSVATVSPGNATALGALLLMARDPGKYPPYRPEPLHKWCLLTGLTPPSGRASPSERYGALLDFCDAFIERAQEQDLGLRDRLDAQGLAWTVTQWGIPESWNPEDRAALAAFRRAKLGAGADESEEDRGQRAWLVRPKPHGSATVAQWTRDGFVSLVAQYLGDVPVGSDLATVRAAVEKGYLHQDYAQRLALAGEYHAFLSRMKPDDFVATVVDDRLHVGVITGEPEYTADADTRLRRSVEWASTDTPLSELVPPLPSLLDQQGTVVELTVAIGEMERLVGAGVVDSCDDEETQPAPEARQSVPKLRDATDGLSAALHVSRAWLQEMIDLLQARQQLVFYGPPGTGKTYLARELARHLVGTDDPSRSRLVQFHPSYAYEDFFEGFRPTEGGSFALTPGPLRDMAAAALAAPGEPFVLIIDEMNRANLAKVFGELYFLLEYRDQSIRLQYRPTEAFRLPRNLFFIGTMNTADRSIALVDAAIRRRFAFVELHPDVAPIRDLLANYLAANGQPGEPYVQLLRALNAQIEEADRDLRIGPSYLMRPDVGHPGGLERAWRYDLLPLLEEHYYGRYTREEIHRRFGLDALLGLVGAVADVAESLDVVAAVPAEGPPSAETVPGDGEA